MNNKLILTLVAIVSVSALAMERIGPGTDPKTTKIVQKAKKLRKKAKDPSRSKRQRENARRRSARLHNKAAQRGRPTGQYDVAQRKKDLLQRKNAFEDTLAGYAEVIHLFLSSTGGDMSRVMRVVLTLTHLVDINNTLAEKAKKRAEDEAHHFETAGGAKDQKGDSIKTKHLARRNQHLKQEKTFAEAAKRHDALKTKLTDEMTIRRGQKKKNEDLRVNRVIATLHGTMGIKPSSTSLLDPTGLAGDLSTLSANNKGKSSK